MQARHEPSSMEDSSPSISEAAREPDFSGRTIGDYELIRRLGRGGMAEVYLARQMSLGRQVAFKVLRTNLSADDKYIRRFQQEARAAASLVHANIVAIHEVGCINGVHFIAQEYVQGQNLKQYLHRNGPADAKVAVRVMRQVAAALHRSAQQNIIHRDIKPENIMLSSAGEVKVADFGLARVGPEGQGLDLTQIGVTMGTPLYMSPEQVEGKPVDPRSDIYSLGVTCYHMLAGRPPFEGDTALSIALQHLKQEPKRLEDLRRDLPPGLCRIVHTMLAKAPADRFQNATELLKELRALRIEGDEVEWASGLDEWSDAELAALASARSEATQQLAAVMQSQAVAQRRWRLLTMAVVLLVVVAFGGGAGLAWLNRPPSLLEIPASQQPRVPQMDSVRSQYIYASLVGTEAALRSVEAYFKPALSAENRLYVRRAWQRLGELYLMSRELDMAMEIYTKLADTVEDTEVNFRSVGLAGQAIVYSRRGDKVLAAAKLTEAIPLMRDLNPAEVQALLTQLDPELRQQLERLRQESRGPTENL